MTSLLRHPSNFRSRKTSTNGKTFPLPRDYKLVFTVTWCATAQWTQKKKTKLHNLFAVGTRFVDPEYVEYLFSLLSGTGFLWQGLGWLVYGAREGNGIYRKGRAAIVRRDLVTWELLCLQLFWFISFQTVHNLLKLALTCFLSRRINVTNYRHVGLTKT